MARYIDADALIETMRKKEEEFESVMCTPNWWTAFDVIKNQPTAYDVDKVVAELAEADDGYCWMCGGGIDCRTAIDIVKRGGINE